MSVDTDLAVLGPAVTEAVTLLAQALGLEARPGEGFDLWGQGSDDPGGGLAPAGLVWSAGLVGPQGPCGEVAIALPPGSPEPDEADIAKALATCVPAFNRALGASGIGAVQRTSAEALSAARPGQAALAVPLLAGGAPAAATTGPDAGLFVLISAASQVAAELPHLDPSPGLSAARSIAALGEVEMTVSVELGRTKIPIRDLLSIHNGAVVQLDRVVTQPVDLFVQGTLIARGEVVVVDDCFAVRVTELLTGD
jgi:flagellar motor switch protein FliN